MKKINIRFIIPVFLSIIMLFASCKSPFYEEGEYGDENLIVPQGFCMLTAKSESLSGRTAFPSSLGNIAYWAVIKAPDGKYLTNTPASPISTTPTLLSNKGTDTNLKFLFVSCAQSGNYTISIYAFDSDFTPAPSDTEANYKAKIGTVIYLAANAPSISLGSLKLQGNTTQSGKKGRVDLSINVSPSSQIKRIELGLVSPGGTLPSDEGLEADLSTSPKKIRHKGEGISPGIYTVTIKAYDQAGSGGKEIFLQNPVQTITVFSGCTTDKWYGIDGQALTALEIQPIDDTAENTLFVKGDGGVLPVSIISNDNNSGISIVSPLASLSAALKKCTGTGPYTIYVDGNVTEIQPINKAEIDKHVTIKSLSPDSNKKASVKKEGQFKSHSLITIKSGGNLTLENIILDGANVPCSANGSLINNHDGATLTLKDGAELKNGSANQKGGAVYNNGTFNISGSAVIPSSYGAENFNDIYLDKDAMITITGSLTATVSVACINPYRHKSGIQVLQAAGTVNLASEVGKFLVTPKSGVNWTIDQYGKLKK